MARAKHVLVHMQHEEFALEVGRVEQVRRSPSFPSLPFSRLATPVSAKLCFVPRGLREDTHRRTGALAAIGGLRIGDSKTSALRIWRFVTRGEGRPARPS